MAYLAVENVAIKGIAACVPAKIIENLSIYKGDGYEHFVATTGIERKREVSADICSSDLCAQATEKLLSDLQWSKDSIDALIFVSQTPDYLNVPATSVILQNRLGLSQSCFTLDIALGCSGWVYALSVASSLMLAGSIKRVLLLAGDTPTKFCSQDDMSTYPLFGDAGTATALEYDNQNPSNLKFALFSDGDGYKTIIIENGGYRNRIDASSLEKEKFGDNIIRSKTDLALDGMSVFSFGISKAPKVVNQLLEHYCIDKASIDFFTFHQANMFMNEKIRKKLMIPPEKVPYCLADFGNTSCASIPLTLVTQKTKELHTSQLKHIGCGFGVGLSWGAVYFETNSIVCSKLIEI